MPDSGEPPAGAARTKGRFVAWVAGLVGIIVVSVIAGWSLRSVLSPLGEPADASAFTVVDVAQGEIGSRLSLNAEARWDARTVGSNASQGVVTSVNVRPGQRVVAGSVLYTVDLRPVAVAEGVIPSFRTISEGISGEDVAQVQRMLATLGLYAGDVSGTVDYATEVALKDWQERLGVEADGVLRQGDVIFVPTLPSRVVIDSAVITRGANLSGGEDVLRSVAEAPSITISMTASQASMMPRNARVVLSSAGGSQWNARAGSREVNQDSGVVKVALTAVRGGSVCGQTCDQIPVAGRTILSAQVITVPRVVGSVVPTAALVTTASGTTQLIDAGGTPLSVQVIASAQGMSVVEGARDGLSVRIPAISE